MDSVLLEQQLALAMQAAALGTWTWDMASGKTTWDERLEELHGLAPGAFGGTFEDWAAALHPADRAECFARVDRALADPGPYLLLHRTTWPDGSVHWIECRGTVTVDEAGAPTGTIGVAIDVTDRQLRDRALVSRLADEQRLVQTLQQALLPERIPQVPGLHVAARYLPATGEAAIGGDWYAMVPLAGGRMGVAIGDVAGHGLPAVANMADARFSLRALALAESEPDRVLARVDQVVHTFAPDTMITALYGIVDPARRTWSYANAGHIPPVVVGADGRATVLRDRSGPPLGLRQPYQRYDIDLDRGATLVLVTDGLIERRNESITVGLERLASACAGVVTDSERRCDQLLDALLEDENEDDAALVVLTIDRSGA